MARQRELPDRQPERRASSSRRRMPRLRGQHRGEAPRGLPLASARATGAGEWPNIAPVSPRQKSSVARGRRRRRTRAPAADSTYSANGGGQSLIQCMGTPNNRCAATRAPTVRANVACGAHTARVRVRTRRAPASGRPRAPRPCRSCRTGGGAPAMAATLPRAAPRRTAARQPGQAHVRRRLRVPLAGAGAGAPAPGWVRRCNCWRRSATERVTSSSSSWSVG